MADDVLVQTRVPPPVGRWITKQASAEGLTAAAWVRRLLFREMNAMRTEAWAVPIEKKDQQPTTTANWVLERRRDLSATEVEFSLLHGPANPKPMAAVSDGYLDDVPWYKNPSGWRFRLKGSPQPWSILRMVYNSTSAGMEMILRSE